MKWINKLDFQQIGQGSNPLDLDVRLDPCNMGHPLSFLHGRRPLKLTNMANLMNITLVAASSFESHTGTDRPSVFKIDAFGHAVDFLGTHFQEQYDFSWFSDLTTMPDGSILVWYVSMYLLID